LEQQEELRREREEVNKNGTIYDILKLEHKDVKKLLKQIIDSEEYQDNVYRLINKLLSIHMEAEEKFFYEKLVNNPESRPETLEGFEEHEVTKKAMMEPRDKMWDSQKIGAAGTPIELNEGYLFIYHGVDQNKHYSLGAALLDKNNPEKVLYRSEKPILTPYEQYECIGDVPNVVFSCGNVRLDDQVIIYYGGADKVLCGASYELNELLPKN